MLLTTVAQSFELPPAANLAGRSRQEPHGTSEEEGDKIHHDCSNSAGGRHAVRRSPSRVLGCGRRARADHCHALVAHRSLPGTPGDRIGYPVKSCGPRNDGEQVSTITFEIGTNQYIVRNFRCTRVDGSWIWLRK